VARQCRQRRDLAPQRDDGGISLPLGNIPTAWSVVGTADFNGDGKGDILWRDTAGNLAMALSH
jgi:FG-GAP repeat